MVRDRIRRARANAGSPEVCFRSGPMGLTAVGPGPGPLSENHDRWSSLGLVDSQDAVGLKRWLVSLVLDLARIGSLIRSTPHPGSKVSRKGFREMRVRVRGRYLHAAAYSLTE